MKHYLIHAVICLTVISFSSCDNMVVGIRAKRFMSQPIVFPEALSRVNGTGGVHVDLSENKTRLVVYIDSSSCSSCSLSRLSRFSSYAALSNIDTGFEVVVLLWPDFDSRIMAEKDLEHRSFPFDVFVDYKGDFAKSNPAFPRLDSRFHCFLINEENVPLMVGDPTSSKELETLFKEYYHFKQY